MSGTDRSSPPATRMRNHWTAHPIWETAERFYTWYFTFEGQDRLHRLAADYQAHLRTPALDLIPMQWLHMTTQGVGPTEELDPNDVERLATAATARCATLSPIDVTLGPAAVDPEGVFLQVTPAHAVARVRHELRAAIADVWGKENVPESVDDFTPHVTLGYSNDEGPLPAIAELVEAAGPRSVSLTLTSVQLVVLRRDERLYHWTTRATVPLGESLHRGSTS
jgi:2'-5' RNA ligase